MNRQYNTMGNWLGAPFEDISSRQIDNLFPFPIDVKCGNFQTKLQPFAKIIVSGKEFSVGDRMAAFYLGKLITHGTVTARASHIRIGDVISQSIEKVFYSMKGDLQHITFHNLLPIPISLYYKGNKIGIAGGNDGKGYFGGSSSTLDLNNETFGFYLGDRIQVKLIGLKKDPRVETEWLSFELVDSKTTDIFIGNISMGFAGLPDDRSAYKLDEPQMGWTGIAYYSSLGRQDPYNTYSTNPNVPF
jgi:hypothetical protein